MNLTLSMLIGIFCVGAMAGCLGALVGIGGGLIIVPVLVLGFGVSIKLAVAASLVSVVASSTSASSVYVGKGLANMRLGMSLEIATTLGGISGGILALLVSPQVISMLFAIMMVVTSLLILRSKEPESVSKAHVKAHPIHPTDSDKEPEGKEDPGTLAGSYYDTFHKRLVHYHATRVGLGAAISFIAGILSGMLGVGGGFLKVPAMALGMRVPIKVAAATSNFMIGVTAISSLFVYFARGLIHPLLAAPIALGVVPGAFLGTSLAQRVSPVILKKILSIILIVVAVQMVFKAAGVGLG